ncbi:hypothetical protein AAF712_003311 [Marasmius tenuissimus]|uniref:Protein kinase domain-containing protein n=1 Tax=Marasmius tenuissimus TaxID=585030 RepID=A0ABR3A7R8_9AGAR
MSRSSESSVDSALETETLVILLFGLKLVRIHSLKWIRVSELLTNIYDSEEYDFPPEIHNLMKTYKPRHLRYIKPLVAYAIHDLTNTPTDLHAIRTKELNADLGYSTECSLNPVSGDGTCLNLIVEEPLPIEQVHKNYRFRSREVVLFLKQHEVDVYPSGLHPPQVSFGKTQDGKELWCKLTNKREVEVFRKLKDHDPASHHIATLFLEPYLLPNGDWLITMPDLGEDLDKIVSNAPQYLAGPVMLRIARDLCSAISFLHSQNMYHLDIKPQNLLAHIAKDCEFTVADLGWVTSGRYVAYATGTYDYAPPEVRRWFEWEEAQKEGGDSGDQPPPERYSTRKADAWAIGNAIAILLRRMLKSDEPPHVDHRHDLKKFAKWMMAKRPPMKVALEALGRIGVPSPVDSAVEDVSRSTCISSGGV